MISALGSRIRISISLAALTTVAVAQSSWVTPLHQAERKGEALMLRGFYLSGSIVRPDIVLQCKDGKLVSSEFDTFVVTGKAGQKNVVMVRIDGNKERAKLWRIAENSRSLKADSGFVRKLVSADRIQIEFPTLPSGSMVAEFRPSRSDVPRIRKACGVP